MIVEELIGRLGWDLQGEGDLKRFQSGMKDAERGLESFIKTAGIMAAAVGAATAGAMVALGKSVISTSAQFESYQATLETIEGSAEKAKASLDWVADFAKTTPYDIAGVTESFVRLKAYGIDPMDGTLRAAGDAGAAMGYGLMQGVEAIADAMTGENERLKAFGITTSVAGDQITYSWQENGKSLNKTLKKNGAEIVKFLNENFGRRFGGAMDKQSRTWNGMIANLGDTWTEFERRIGEAGFFDTVKGQLDKVMNYIDRLDEDGTIDRWATNLSRAFIASTNAIGFAFDHLSKDVVTAIELLERLGKSVSDTINKLTGGKIDLSNWQTVATFFGLLAARLFPVTALLGAAYLALNDFLTYMRGGESVIGDFIQALADFLGSDPDKVARVLGDMATGAAGIAGAAAGVLMFSGALKTLAGAVGLFGTGAAAGGSKNLLKLLGLGAAVWGGIESLTNPTEEFKNAPRLKLGVDDAIRWMLGTDKPKNSGHPYMNPPIQSGAARSAEEQSRQFNAFAGYEDRMNGGGPVVPSPEQAAAASLAWLKNAFSSITAKLDNPAFVKGMENMQANLAATQPAAAAAAVSTTMTDNRQYPVTVDVGGVTVQGVANATTAVGAAVGQAVGRGAANAASARDATRLYSE